MINRWLTSRTFQVTTLEPFPFVMSLVDGWHNSEGSKSCNQVRWNLINISFVIDSKFSPFLILSWLCQPFFGIPSSNVLTSLDLHQLLIPRQRHPIPHPEERFGDPAPDPHPLGKAKAEIVRPYWVWRPGDGIFLDDFWSIDSDLGEVPTIPGYSGYVSGSSGFYNTQLLHLWTWPWVTDGLRPGKHAENIHGGGIIHTCKMVAESQWWNWWFGFKRNFHFDLRLDSCFNQWRFLTFPGW